MSAAPVQPIAASAGAPVVSVVVETVTLREEPSALTLAERLDANLSAVAAQTYPRDRYETIVVVDGDVAPAEVAGIQARYPWVRLAQASAQNYFAAKNAGAELARGSIVVLVDGDCVPDRDWLESLVSTPAGGTSVVAGRTRYAGTSWSARTFSVSDFGNVAANDAGEASGFNLNNVAFARELLRAHPLDASIRRNGGCYLLFHQLRRRGVAVIYQPRATVTHGLDIAGLGFVHKHFDRGFDGVSVYRADADGVLRGTRVFRRFGALALLPLSARRLLLDWLRLFRTRRQVGIATFTLPYFCAVMAVTRSIELAGGLTASLGSRPALAPDARPGRHAE